MTKSVKAYAAFLPELRQLLAMITDLVSTTTTLVLAMTILIRGVR